LKRYQQVTIFHAENDADATEQVDRALGSFDDGYERVALREVFTLGSLDRLVFIEGEDRKRISPADG